jgi:hypothetical protein
MSDVLMRIRKDLLLRNNGDRKDIFRGIRCMLGVVLCRDDLSF